jgi:hypothetical protein
MTRIEANKEILKALSAYILKYPNIRFSQALCNLSLVSVYENDGGPNFWYDEYNTESETLLKRIPKQ